MWSDPEDIEDWAINARGAGWVFGSKVTNDFCHINGLELIARAHQLVQEGYIHWFKVRKKIHRIKTWWQSGVLRTIVTDAITWQRSWKWRKTVKKSLRSSRRFQSQWRALTSKMFYPTSYDRMYSIFSIFFITPFLPSLKAISPASLRWGNSPEKPLFFLPFDLQTQLTSPFIGKTIDWICLRLSSKLCEFWPDTDSRHADWLSGLPFWSRVGRQKCQPFFRKAADQSEGEIVADFPPKLWKDHFRESTR